MSGGVSARFRLTKGDFTLDVALELPARGVHGVLGPSGAGKTILLRCFAGLERPRDGHLTVGGAVWQNAASFTPPYRRAVGFVFQQPRLFEHMTVANNLIYGWRRTPPSRRREVAEIVELLDIRALMTRTPRELSGGEAQRIALGRALLIAPELLLLDEPLSALDPARKNEILPYLDRVHRELDMPVIYVSHDLDELVRLSETLAVMRRGRIEAHGPVADVLARHDPSRAESTLAVTVAGTAVSHDARHGLTEIELPIGARLTAVGRATGTVRVRLAARDVALAVEAVDDPTVAGQFRARVVEIPQSSRSTVPVLLAAGDQRFLSLQTRLSLDRLGLTPGREVWVVLRHATLADIDRKDGD